MFGPRSPYNYTQKYVGDEEFRVYLAGKSTHTHSSLGICQALTSTCALSHVIPLRNAHSAKDMAPTDMALAYLVWLLAAPSKFRPQVTTCPPIGMNEVVNLLPTYWSPFQMKTTADLLRARVFLQFRYYLSPPHRCKSPRDGRGGVPSSFPAPACDGNHAFRCCA